MTCEHEPYLNPKPEEKPDNMLQMNLPHQSDFIYWERNDMDVILVNLCVKCGLVYWNKKK